MIGILVIENLMQKWYNLSVGIRAYGCLTMISFKGDNVTNNLLMI